MSWEDTLKEQEPDPEKIVEYKMVNGVKVPLNAYGTVPPLEHQKVLDEIKQLEAKIKEMESMRNKKVESSEPAFMTRARRALREERENQKDR